MCQLNKYIGNLLFIHDCVILPGFGGFVTNYHGAEHENLSNTFHPPKKDILFNQNLTYNDGLLINYMAKNLKIDYKSAEDVVKSEVQNIWLKLEDNEEVIFGGIGQFRIDKDQRLVFQPSSSENYLADSYGLSSFRFPPLNYQKTVHKLTSTYNSGEMNNGLKQTLKWAAIAIPIIGVLATIPYVKNDNEQTAKFGIVDSIMKDTPIENTHTALAPDTNIEGMMNKVTDKRTALFYSENKQTVTIRQETKGKTFYIIGASYKDLTNANNHANSLKENGHDAEVIETNNLYRVSLASFDDKVNALHELRRIRYEEKNDKVWLFSN